MSNAFAVAFEKATTGIRQCDLAQTMAELTGRDARSWVASLSRIQNGNQIPRTSTIKRIADAVGTLTNRSSTETVQLRSRLTGAAVEAEERRRLHSDCREALQKNPNLNEHAIQNMVDHLGLAVMRKIIEADKRGAIIGDELLTEATADLQQASAEYSGGTVINAGRARILIEGEVTPAQMIVLRKAAGMIESVVSL